MQALQQTMLEIAQYLEDTAKRLEQGEFLSGQDYMQILQKMDQLRESHKRCCEAVAAETGSDLSDCTCLRQLTERLEQHRQNQQHSRELLQLAADFSRITGEADYGFALIEHQKQLQAKSLEQLQEMDKAGQLEPYRQLLQILGKTGLDASQVEPFAQVFGFPVAFGLLAGKFVLQQDLSEPAPEQPAKPAEQPEETQPEEVQQEETQPEEQLPTVELPGLVVEKSGKKPKGESALYSTCTKLGLETGFVLTAAAYVIIDEWGCPRSVVYDRLGQEHSKKVMDRAIDVLYKEGYVHRFRLEGEDGQDLYYNASQTGFQILNKDSVQRRLHINVEEYGLPKITDAAVFTRLRRMNEVYETLFLVPDASITRVLESGFAGQHLIPVDREGLCHFPLVYTKEDTPEALRKFLEYFLTDSHVISPNAKILLEVPEGQQEFWLTFFREEFLNDRPYYVSAWGANAYSDDQGNVYTLEELAQSCYPPEPPEEAPVEEAPAEEAPMEETPAEETPAEEAPMEETPAEETPAEETPVEEVPVEEAPVEEAPAEEAPVEEDPVEETPVEEKAAPCTCSRQKYAEKETRAMAQELLQQANPAEHGDDLIALILRLVSEERLAEALVLAKTLTTVSRDERIVALFQDLLHGSNLPLQERSYSAYLEQEYADSDLFGCYSKVSAALWAACFPKMAYDYRLYQSISMVGPCMTERLPEELGILRKVLSSLTNDLKDVSFERGDGAGLSAGVLDCLASDAVQETKRKKLMQSAAEKRNAPRSSISITGLETLMKTIMGPSGELGLCMKAIAEDDPLQYEYVRSVYSRFTNEDGSVSERLLHAYIDEHWDDLRRVEKQITLRRFENESPARKTLQREITKRLENMDEWLKRHSGVASGSFADMEAFRPVVGKICKNMAETVSVIGQLLPGQQEPGALAGLQLLRYVLSRIQAIIRGEEEMVQDSREVFACLLTTPYPVLDSTGDPLVEEAFNALAGAEPWRLLLRHVAAQADCLEDALQQIEEHDSERYEDYGSAVILRTVLGLPAGDYDDLAARRSCLDLEESFLGDVRMACAYGQLAEEDKETLFAQLNQYRGFFIPEADSQAWGNYAHYRMLLDCLKEQAEAAKRRRKSQFRQFYEERAQYYQEDQIPSMLRRVLQELDKDNLATAEEYLTRYDAGMHELPQETAYAAEFNFHSQYLSCADWFCAQCEKPENKNRGPKDWGRRVLQDKNFWSASNERNSADALLENWPYRKGDTRNPGMLRFFLSQIGLPVQQVFHDQNRPSTSQYEVFVANTRPVDTGREDYSHPVAKFGTQMAGTLHIVCLYGCKGAATLIDIMTKKLQLGGNTIVIMDGVVNVLERRRVAAQFKSMTSGQNAFLLIDRVLMLFLAAQDSGNRLNAMLQCTMPYIYEQLYTEGAGAVADEMFMGRIAERKSLCDANGACLVYGGRQLGKTALLRRVESINHKPHEQRYAIYMDIKERGSDYFIQELKEKLLSLQTEQPLLSGTETDLAQICASLQRNSGLYQQLTILIDEVDVYFQEISSNNYNDIHPVVLLQDELRNKVKFVFAGTHNVAATSKAIEDNADIIKLRQPLCIKPLSSADAMQLIRWPLAYLGFEIGEQQIAMILANTNSYPGLIHLFCNSLVKSICENYSKYYDVSKGNPPYTVSDAQLRTIFREKDIKREIAKRVIATIKVNPRYRIVANLIAFMEYQDQENGTPRLYGYTPAEVQSCNAREFEIVQFLPDHIGLGDLDALMEEMEKMGILWKNHQTGSYRFRQRDFVGYIGSYNEVMQTLLGGV